MVIILISLASFFISLLATSVIKSYFSQQLLDLPNQRSSHSLPTPRGGGLGFVIALAISGLITSVLY